MPAKYTIDGVIRPRQGRTSEGDASVIGYRITANYKLHVGDAVAGFDVPTTRSARVADEDGKFSLRLDDRTGVPIAPIEITVSPPTGEIQLQRTLDLSELGRTLRLRVTVPRPEPIEPSPDPGKGARLRVTGRVADREGAEVPAGLPVVILAAADEGDPDRPLITATTQRSGGFALDWPAQRFASASARVAGGEAQPIWLDEGFLPQTLLLVIDLEAVQGDQGDHDHTGDDCQCDIPPPLAPDSADLAANPEAFSQDLGGACIDLTVPNRSLEEFLYYTAVRTTEPRITAFTIDPSDPVPDDLMADLLGVSIASESMGLTQRSAVQLTEYNLTMSIEAADRIVRSDDPPSVYQLADAGWQAELDEVKVAIDAGIRETTGRQPLDIDNAIDWDETPTVHLAIDIAHGHLLTFKESFKSDGYSLGRLLHSLPLPPNARRQIAVVDWDRRTRSSRSEQLDYEEQLDALLTRDRDIREIVSSELDEDIEASSSNKTFGIGGGAGAGFIGPGWGIFGGVAGGYGRSSSTSSQEASREYSAESMQSLQDRISQRSTSLRSQRSTVVQSVSQGETARAETEFIGNYNRCHSITMQFFQVLRHYIVTHELAHAQECLFVPLPIDHFDDAKALRWKEVLRRHLRDRRLAGGFRAMQRIADDWVGWEVPEGAYADDPPEFVDGELRISFVIPRPRDDVDGAFQVDMWDKLAPFIHSDPLELYTAKFNEETQRSRDLVFQREVAPIVAESLVDRLRVAYVTAEGEEVDVPIDPTLVSKYHEGRPLYVSLGPRGRAPAIPRADITHIKISYDGEPLPPNSQVIVESGKLRYTTDSLTALFFDRDRILDDLDVGDDVVIPAPLTQAELRNAREEDRELAARLRDHLNEHIEYYHQAIWMSLDPQRRFMLLDAVVVPGTGGRSVASVCANQIIGVVGNSLVLPVAPGTRLDPTFAGTDDDGNPVPLIDAYASPPPPPIRISLPTRGVHGEAVSGACNACEEIDDSRYWRWTNEGLLEVPQIEAVSTDSRATDEPDLTPTDLPAPLVTIQNAPAAPDPTGLGPAFGLLSTPGLFRDVTGLEGTQQNAGAAMQGAVAAGSAIGEEAYKLATQNALGQNAQRLMGQLGAARDRGLLTDDAYTALGTDLMNGLLGSTKPAAPVPWLDPELAEAASNATSGQISASTPDEAVDIMFDNGSATDEEPVGEYEPSAPLILREMVAPEPHNFEPISYSHLLAVLGEHAAMYVDRGYVAQADDGSDTLLVEQNLRVVYPLSKGTSEGTSDSVAGSGRHPVVVLAHGQARGWTDTETIPNLDGFAALQDALARVGIISISVDLNAVAHIGGHTPNLGVGLLLTAFDRIETLNLDPQSVLYGSMDLARLGALAHSTGVDSLIGVIEANSVRPSWERLDLAAVCLVAPIVDGFSALISPLDTDAMLILQPGLDGEAPAGRDTDLSFFTGIPYHDLSTCSRSLVVLDGCNHRRFNEVWAADNSGDDALVDVTEGVDDDRLLSTDDHRDLLIEYARALFRWRFFGDPVGTRDLVDGSWLNSLGAPISVHHSLGEHRRMIDSMEPEGPDSGERTLTNSSIDTPDNIVIDGTAMSELSIHMVGNVLWVPPGQGSETVYLLEPDGVDIREYDEFLFRVATDFDIESASAIESGRLPEFTLRFEGFQGSVEFEAAALRRSEHSLRPIPHVIRHLDGSTENVTTLQFRTMSVSIPTIVDGLDESWLVSKISLITTGNFPQHLFFTDFEVVRR